MKNLKNLASKANSDLTLNSKTKKHFGLENFIAASSSEMLMTRGGYGPPQWAKEGGGTRVYTSGMGRFIGGGASRGGFGPGGAVGNIGNSVAQGFGNMIGSFNRSAVGQFLDGAVESITSAWDRLTPSDIIGVFSTTAGKIFKTQSTGSNADCPPGNFNPKCPNSNPNYQGPY